MGPWEADTQAMFDVSMATCFAPSDHNVYTLPDMAQAWLAAGRYLESPAPGSEHTSVALVATGIDTRYGVGLSIDVADPHSPKAGADHCQEFDYDDMLVSWPDKTSRQWDLPTWKELGVDPVEGDLSACGFFKDSFKRVKQIQNCVVQALSDDPAWSARMIIMDVAGVHFDDYVSVKRVALDMLHELEQNVSKHRESILVSEVPVDLQEINLDDERSQMQECFRTKHCAMLDTTGRAWEFLSRFTMLYTEASRSSDVSGMSMHTMIRQAMESSETSPPHFSLRDRVGTKLRNFMDSSLTRIENCFELDPKSSHAPLHAVRAAESLECAPASWDLVTGSGPHRYYAKTVLGGMHRGHQVVRWAWWPKAGGMLSWQQHIEEIRWKMSDGSFDQGFQSLHPMCGRVAILLLSKAFREALRDHREFSTPSRVSLAWCLQPQTTSEFAIGQCWTLFMREVVPALLPACKVAT